MAKQKQDTKEKDKDKEEKRKTRFVWKKGNVKIESPKRDQ